MSKITYILFGFMAASLVLCYFTWAGVVPFAFSSALSALILWHEARVPADGLTARIDDLEKKLTGLSLWISK